MTELLQPVSANMSTSVELSFEGCGRGGGHETLCAHMSIKYMVFKVHSPFYVFAHTHLTSVVPVHKRLDGLSPSERQHS